MALPHFFLLAFIVSAAHFQVMTSSTCHEHEYYNRTLKQCCGKCPEGTVKRFACIQDINKDCAEPCSAGEFINWNRSPPQCATCNKCNIGDQLVEIQSCSLHTEAVCQCQDGLYCQSPLGKTCVRCKRHKECPPGQGVKTKGTSEKDTVCEACPPGTYSSINSATENCKPHTDCANLQTLRKGDSMKDTVCKTSGHTTPDSEKKNDVLENKRSGDNAGTIPSAEQRYTTPKVHIVHHISETSTASFAMTSTKDNEGTRGKWNGGYIVALIICILILFVALAMILKQKLCRLKLWIKNTHFIQPKTKPARTEFIYQEDDKEQNLLERQNSARSQQVTLELYQKTEGGQTERAADDKMEMQQGRDHLNNRIEKIYIMNADTVLVGSISDVPGRSQRSVTVESEEKQSLVLESRYPEQESSKVPGNDLMLSIEEEETGGTTAKVILQG
ncbi:tumor necrosis factor receptor superfamily member 8-like [Lithobates pipiens]